MTLVETQQVRMLEQLRSAGERQTTLAELRAAGIDFPAVVISELELNGYTIERIHKNGRLLGVRLLESDIPEAPSSRWHHRWHRGPR
jgi:hypothetical protein